MASRARYASAIAVAVALGISASLTAVQQPAPEATPLPDFDIRSGRAPAAPPAAAREALRLAREQRGDRAARIHPHTGAMRIVDHPSGALLPRTAAATARNLIVSLAGTLALDADDLAQLTLTRDFTSASTGVRTVTFAQSIDGLPVFDGVVTVHAAADGSIVRVTSSAGRGAGRRGNPGGPQANPGTTVWFAMDGVLRLARHSVIASENPKAIYDILTDAASGDLLLRRNRVRYSEGTGRVVQSAETYLLDPRRPDQMPLGAGGAGGCPPVTNHLVRSLNGPFRDSATVLGATGHLSGNNTHVYRRTAGSEGAAGVFGETGWSFDYPFASASAAETSLFFSINFVHDFFYDLGFDEAAGNFQVDNFGRGGAGGDPVFALARADGRNNAYYSHAVDGTSPTIAFFLWDGTGCWSQDVDGDGTVDIDGTHDTDVIIHEFHHGVSLRLNTVWAGDEAAAIGEGGGDFFAYSVNGDTNLADYSRTGGIRSVNSKTYADWWCFFSVICFPHSNGEIWANALWDVRERFRTDLVRGTEAVAVNESHQLYIDALKLSPPAPTMLDMRDAMLLADSFRNPGTPRSENFCRLWESFAARGMGVDATDTADNGLNKVAAAFNVPEGCVAPPAPPTITLSVVTATATEAGPTSGMFRISRGSAQPTPIAVNYTLAGSATTGADDAALPLTVTIPADAASIDVAVSAIDDTTYESNETVTLTVRADTTYIVGSPSSGTVTIVSNDVAPDFTVTAFTVTKKAAAGGPAVMTDTTKNQGAGAAAASTTSYYLSKNTVLDAADTPLGGREVPALAPGATHAGSATVTIPGVIEPGTYTVFAKADGPGAVAEAQESNNTRTTTIQIGPDLMVTALSAPSAAAPGTTISVSDTTTNEGAAAVAGSSVTRFYLSPNTGYDASDLPLHARTVLPLGVGGASPATTNVTIPATTATGLYYVIARADADISVAESVETNNTRSVLLRVGPDLTVASLTAPSDVTPGIPFAVSDTTTNSGEGAAAASITALYLSSNSTLDAADVQLSAGREVPSLGTGMSSIGSTTVTLSGVAAGTWYLIARADDASAVEEVRENNNTRARSIRVGAASASLVHDDRADRNDTSAGWPTETRRKSFAERTSAAAAATSARASAPSSSAAGTPPDPSRNSNAFADVRGNQLSARDSVDPGSSLMNVMKNIGAAPPSIHTVAICALSCVSRPIAPVAAIRQANRM